MMQIMETDLKKVEATVEASLDTAGSLAPLASDGESSAELKAMLGKGVEVISNLDTILGKFFNEYRQLIVSLGLVFGAIVSVKLTLALLSALNEIPLVEPLLELVGLGYTAWFVVRFMLKSEKRQEFYAKFSDTKESVLGKK
jgi:CAAD domains of cyanobacterial aminoacyl-tRNA synthetase